MTGGTPQPTEGSCACTMSAKVRPPLLHCMHTTAQEALYILRRLAIVWRPKAHAMLSCCSGCWSQACVICSFFSSGEGPGYLLGEPATVIAPLGGRLVVFDSRLHHEVLASHKPRLVHAPVLSITPHSWMSVVGVSLISGYAAHFPSHATPETATPKPRRDNIGATISTSPGHMS